MNSGHVYLIDSDQHRREGLANVLTTQRYRLSAFDDVPSFLDTIDYDHLPGGACVLTHLNLSPLTGVDLLDVFRADRVVLPAVLMGSTTELPLAVRAMRYGGAYILWQPFGTAQLLEVVANMVREWRSKPPENVPALDPITPHVFVRRFATLSTRQRQVLQHVFEGEGNRAIADTLGISVKTVELHRSCMMRKMRAESTIDLVKMMSRFRHVLEHCA